MSPEMRRALTETISFIYETHEWELSSNAATCFIMCRIHGFWLCFSYQQVWGDESKSHNPWTENNKQKVGIKQTRLGATVHQSWQYKHKRNICRLSIVERGSLTLALTYSFSLGLIPSVELFHPQQKQEVNLFILRMGYIILRPGLLNHNTKQMCISHICKGKWIKGKKTK